MLCDVGFTWWRYEFKENGDVDVCVGGWMKICRNENGLLVIYFVFLGLNHVLLP